MHQRKLIRVSNEFADYFFSVQHQIEKDLGYKPSDSDLSRVILKKIRKFEQKDNEEPTYKI